MIILFFALLLGVLTFVLVAFIFGVISAILPSIAVVLVVYFMWARQVSKRLEAAMLEAQTEMQKGRVDRGLALLNSAKIRFKYWQFFTESALNGQIGSIYYLRQEFDRARPYLEKSFVRHWIARGMFGILQSRQKEYEKMDQTFESALRYSSRQGLLWSLWAYCHWKAGHQDKAIDILLRGQKKLGDADSRLSANLVNLQNHKKMKMRGYGEQWYQFHLEMSPQMKEMRTRQTRFVQR
jgi:tetratricopeptide (TPR) repeat protein